MQFLTSFPCAFCLVVLFLYFRSCVFCLLLGAAQTRLANFNLLVAAASQAADRDFATTRTPPPPPGRVDVRSSHKPRAPRA